MECRPWRKGNKWKRGSGLEKKNSVGSGAWLHTDALLLGFMSLFCLLPSEHLEGQTHKQQINEHHIKWHDIMTWKPTDAPQRWHRSAPACIWGSLGVTTITKHWSHSSDVLLRGIVIACCMFYCLLWRREHSKTSSAEIRDDLPGHYMSYKSEANVSTVLCWFNRHSDKCRNVKAVPRSSGCRKTSCNFGLMSYALRQGVNRLL